MFDGFISNITEEMTEQEIKDYIGSKEHARKYKEEILALSDRVKYGESLDEIISEIRKQIKNENFFDIILSDLNNNLQPYMEAQYLRKLEFTEFQKIINIIFEKAILTISSAKQLQTMVDIDTENLKYIVKFLNYSKYIIIAKRYSKELFINMAYEMFRFEQQFAEEIWSLFDSNRNELIVSVMMDNYDMIRDIKNSVSMILKIFEDIIDSE